MIPSTLDGTVLVTGGAGFLGRTLVSQLLALGSCRVRVLALPQEATPADWAGLVEVLRGDITRPANIIGPGSGPWVHDAARALRQGLPALVGGGRGNASLAVVDNVADFLVHAARTPGAWGEVYNVHDGLDVSWQAYFNDLAALLGAMPPRSIPRRLAYLAAHTSEPVFRRFLVHQRPPVTREALNLIAWDGRFPLDKARALGWVPQVGYATVMARIRDAAP